MDLMASKLTEKNLSEKAPCLRRQRIPQMTTPKDKTYSGSEATEFHLARMYAFVNVLHHDFPIIVDSFRAEDLSSDREMRVLQIRCYQGEYMTQFSNAAKDMLITVN